MTLADKNIDTITKYDTYQPNFRKRFVHAQYDANAVTGYRLTLVKILQDSKRAVLET